MPSRLLAGEQVRRNFGKIPKIIAFPNLVEMQKESYARSKVFREPSRVSSL
jgi:hypothetical protein